MSESPDTSPRTVVVAGASGFLGRALGEALADRFHLIGLSRGTVRKTAPYAEFRAADLFSLRDAEKALEGADAAVYLVHSMLPSARLMQGHFSDMDLICADNFARAAARAGVRHIVYVGGLLPPQDALSAHLRSRSEVEVALGASGVPVTTLRAGVIVGPDGSSYQVMRRLVQRLPVMVCPAWTQTRMQPVAIDDVVDAIGHSLVTPECRGRTYDLGAPEALSYQEVMGRVAKSMGLERRFIGVPLLTPRLSRLWVSLTTGAPASLMAPLIESLEHEMVVRPEARLVADGLTPTGIDEMLRRANDALDLRPDEPEKPVQPHAFQSRRQIKEASLVRSVQRMELPEGRSAAWAGEEYIEWLPRALRGLIQVRRSDADQTIEFYTRVGGVVLLQLEHRPDRSTEDRHLFRVAGGGLASDPPSGWLEFRQVMGGRTLLSAVQEFRPRLPWWIYRNTQAVFHQWVMTRFARHLAAADRAT